VSVADHHPVASLYVHVPFCARKCEYCAFYSEASNGDAVNRYVSALVRELELVAHDLTPRTVFFGGGTPSLLNLQQWQAIFHAMDRLGLLGAAEWTIECNPATVSFDKARLWREHGVNRVSMGVQSLNEALLDRLGRVHSRQMVFQSFDILRRAGFDNLNVDLMFAIPGQTLEVWRETLDEALGLGSEHLSSYEVIYEEDTPLFAQLKAGQFSVDEDLACAMYGELVERAAGGGFIQYEIANFARGAGAEAHLDTAAGAPVSDPAGGEIHTETRRVGDRRSARLVESGVSRCSPGLVECCTDGDMGAPPSNTPTLAPSLPASACQHNVNYWRGGFYHGLGPSAAGYVRGTRTKNWSNTALYCEQLEQGRRAIEWQEKLPPIKRAGETAAFGLRMNAGWAFDPFQQTTGFDLRREWKAEMDQLLERGWGQEDDSGFRLTPQGLRFADAAAELFLR
jgi:oxygen-independent coproporphyrinogen-3 oxidase